ncbi:hypothetical protein [Mycobacterium sp. C31M]
MSDALTAEQHISALETDDVARVSVAERHDAARTEVDGYLSTLPEWQQLVPYRLGELMAIAQRIAEHARVTYASDPSDDLAYGAQIASDFSPFTVTPPYTPEPVGPVPVGLFISQITGSPTLERHYAFGSRTLPDIAADALAAAREDRGCDLRLLQPTGLHDSITGRSSHLVWPIALGEHVVFVRYCSECLGALIQKYEIVVPNCQFVTPYRVG